MSARRSRWLTPLFLIVLGAGCGSEPRHVGDTSSEAAGRASNAAAPVAERGITVGVSNDNTRPVARASKTGAPVIPDRGFIVGKRTQDIQELGPEMPKGGKVATTKITAKDPITLSGNVYVTQIGKIALGQIEHAVRLFQAANDRYPKDHQEFMDVIIKENNISLPVLPSYQEYRYDVKEHKLVIIEYPELKNAPAAR